MLSGEEIYQRLREPDPLLRLTISPLLEPELQLHEAGVDLRLGVVFLQELHSQSMIHDVFVPPSPSANLHETIHVPLFDYLVLQPGQIILGATLEFLAMPRDVVGQISLRSSWARLGLSLTSDPKIHAGARLTPTLPLYNQSRSPIKLYTGLRICHLTLFRISMDSQADSNSSLYEYAIGPQPSRFYRDPERLMLKQRGEIIGITGHVNAGKSRLARKYAEKYDVPIKKPSTMVHKAFERAKGRLPQDGKELQTFKRDLRERRGSDVLVRGYVEEMLATGGKGIVIDGVDHPDEADYLKRFPTTTLVAAVAKLDFRWDRYRGHYGPARDLNKWQFRRLDKRLLNGEDLEGEKDEYRDRLQECIDKADFSIHTDLVWGSIDDWIVLKDDPRPELQNKTSSPR